MQPSWLHSHTCENPPCGGLFIEHSVLEFFGGVRSVEAEKKLCQTLAPCLCYLYPVNNNLQTH